MPTGGQLHCKHSFYTGHTNVLSAARVEMTATSAPINHNYLPINYIASHINPKPDSYDC